MRKLQVLLLGVAVFSMGLVLPNQARAAHCDDPFGVYAEYARAIVAVTFRGTDAMDDVVDEATPRIRRLLNAGMYERARGVAGQAIDKIESIGDKTHGKIRELATEGVRALTDLEGDVPSDVLRRLVSKLLKLAQRAANFVSDAEEDSVNSIKRLFPQVSDVDRRSRD